jgi:hypothetical protein
MDTTDTSAQSGELRMRLYVSTRVLTEISSSFLTVESTVFEVEDDVKDDFG